MTTARYKEFSSTIRKAEGDTLDAIVSTISPDRDHDTVDPRGILLENYKKNPCVLWAHQYSQLPVAKALSIAPTDATLVARLQFAEHQFARDVRDLYATGFLSAFSIGFIPLEQMPNDAGGVDITACELLEFSCVPVPANAEALVLAAKALGIPGVRKRLGIGPESEAVPIRRIEKPSRREVSRAIDELLAPLIPDPFEAACRDPAIVRALLANLAATVDDAVRHEMARVTGKLPD